MSKENQIPNRVDPFRFADQAISAQVILPLNQMTRLQSNMLENSGKVLVNIDFGVDEQDVRFIRGHFSTEITLQCQRCMEPLKQEIRGDFLSGIVHDEKEANQLPQNYDPLIIKDGTLFISEMIEDELIISLPIVPMHPLDSCKVSTPYPLSESVRLDKESPFKVIEFLHSKKQNSE